MTVILWIIAAIVLVYLTFAISAGLAAYFHERKFKNSPDRPVVVEIIQEYRDRLSGADKVQLDKIVVAGQREIIHRNGVDFSVDLTSIRQKKNKYQLIISVGRLHSITIGHAQKFEIETV